MTLAEKILDFLERYLPVFLLGFKLGKNAGNKLSKENVELKLELESEKNKDEIKSHNASLSDDDLRAEILARLNPDDKNTK